MCLCVCGFVCLGGLGEGMAGVDGVGVERIGGKVEVLRWGKV